MTRRRRPVPRVRCGAIMANRFQCGAQAKWWVRIGHGMARRTEPRCGGHARAWLYSWPMLSADADADEAIDAGVFV